MTCRKAAKFRWTLLSRVRGRSFAVYVEATYIARLIEKIPEIFWNFVDIQMPAIENRLVRAAHDWLYLPNLLSSFHALCMCVLMTTSQPDSHTTSSRHLVVWGRLVGNSSAAASESMLSVLGVYIIDEKSERILLVYYCKTHDSGCFLSAAWVQRL